MTARILVVDDDADHLYVIREKLRHCGYDVEGAESAERALGRLASFDPRLVITDLRMPGMSGLELLERIRSSVDGVEVMVMTGHQDMKSAVAAMKAGAFDYLVKPIDLGRLQDQVERCLRERELESGSLHEEEESEEERGTLVGRDPRMVEIFKMIGILARNRATVFIRGETGTGKEVVARAIHTNSVYADEPFIAVNCTALSDTLLESELFGHVRGAFTGATSRRRGYFELARGGTIFLDEIGDTIPDFQSKLLRVLQDRSYYPVGGETPLETKARVIVATNRPIERQIREGRFREDLYFRLKVIEVEVPPLRERRGDIPLLAVHLLGRIRREIGEPVRHISDEAMEKLKGYDWPGNVRELENLLLRAAILARSGVIGAAHLTFEPPAP